MTKYLIDTCIWLDYYENRSDKFRPLGDWALELLNLITKIKAIVIISDYLIRELLLHYDLKTVQNIISIIPRKQQLRIVISNNLLKKAAAIVKIRNVSFIDAVHAVTAGSHRAIIITRDHHFEELTDIAPFAKPEDLI